MSEVFHQSGGLKLIRGDESHLAWAAKRIGLSRWPSDSHCLAIEGEDGTRCVVVYNLFTPTTCQAHIATNGLMNWATRGMLYGIFALPFLANNLLRINLPIAAKNKKAMKLAISLGFLPVASVHHGADDGGIECYFGMTRDECDWIKEG